MCDNLHLDSLKQCETPLNKLFFSPYNKDLIQRGIRQTFKNRTGIAIDYQNPDDLYGIMRAVFISNSGDHYNNINNQVRDMVGNHVADIVERYGENSNVPKALTDYIKGRQGYDYNEHGRAGNSHTTFVPDEIVDRFCILGDADEHIRRLTELKELGVDQFAVYLQHDGKEETLEAYGEKILPAIQELGKAKQ